MNNGFNHTFQTLQHGLYSLTTPLHYLSKHIQSDTAITDAVDAALNGHIADLISTGSIYTMLTRLGNIYGGGVKDLLNYKPLIEELIFDQLVTSVGLWQDHVIFKEAWAEYLKYHAITFDQLLVKLPQYAFENLLSVLSEADVHATDLAYRKSDTYTAHAKILRDHMHAHGVIWNGSITPTFLRLSAKRIKNFSTNFTQKETPMDNKPVVLVTPQAFLDRMKVNELVNQGVSVVNDVLKNVELDSEYCFLSEKGVMSVRVAAQHKAKYINNAIIDRFKAVGWDGHYDADAREIYLCLKASF